MAIDFSKFANTIDLDELEKEIQKSHDNDYQDVPDGTYICSIESMEIKETKKGDKLMFAVSAKIKEGEYKNRLLFFNRVINGNKTSEKWNDLKAVTSVITWVNKLVAEGETPIEFINYQDFAEQILDVFQLINGAVEVEIAWASGKFNPMTIKEVYDL